MHETVSHYTKSWVYGCYTSLCLICSLRWQHNIRVSNADECCNNRVQFCLSVSKIFRKKLQGIWNIIQHYFWLRFSYYVLKCVGLAFFSSTHCKYLPFYTSINVGQFMHEWNTTDNTYLIIGFNLLFARWQQLRKLAIKMFASWPNLNSISKGGSMLPIKLIMKSYSNLI